MLWPTLCIDNFFQNPESIINFSKKLEFKKTEGFWPGERTECLSTIDANFFNSSTNKIIKSLYPDSSSMNIRWNANQYFQKIKTDEHKLSGFIHQDIDCEFTSIIYLSDEKEAGTALFKKIKDPVPSHKEIKQKGYLETNNQNEEYFKKALKQNRDCFLKTLEFSSLKNRMILFDSSNFHGVNNFGKKQKERLTLITFFTSIVRLDAPLRFHVNESTKL